MGHHLRPAATSDADDLGAVHVRAWEAAYRCGLMPDEYLDGLTAAGRAGWWRRALATETMPRAARLVAEVENPDHGWTDTGVRRRQEVIGVEVPEARYRRPLP